MGEAELVAVGRRLDQVLGERFLERHEQLVLGVPGFEFGEQRQIEAAPGREAPSTEKRAPAPRSAVVSRPLVEAVQRAPSQRPR